MLLSLSSIVFILEMMLNKNHPSQFSQTIWVSLAEKNHHKGNKHPSSGSGERTLINLVRYACMQVLYSAKFSLTVQFFLFRITEEFGNVTQLVFFFKNQQKILQPEEHFWNARNQTLGCWGRSQNATSVLSSLPPHVYLVSFILQRSTSCSPVFDQTNCLSS